MFVLVVVDGPNRSQSFVVDGSSPSAAGAGSSAWSSKAGTKAEAQWAQQRSGV